MSLDSEKTTILVEHLTKQYGNFTAVNDISFEVRAGEILGFLGPNGAGKTTTMKILTSYLAPTQGRVSVAGFDVSLDSLSARERIGYLPEGTPLYRDMTVLEYLNFVANVRGLHQGRERNARIWKVVEQCGLTDRLGFYIGELSKGFKQRVGLAQAILHEPDVLILDEPTSGLDPNQIVGIREVIREIGREKTVIFSTHIMQEVQAVCSRVLIIAEGQIVADGTLDALKHRAQRQMVLNVEIQGDLSEVKNALSRISGIESVLSLPHTDVQKKQSSRFQLIAKPGYDPRTQIFSMAVEKHFILVELAQELPSLEEVFRTLTKPKTQSELEAA